MSKIIFINQVTGPLMIDIVNRFSESNYEIILYTGKVEKTYSDLNKNIKIRKLIQYRRNNNFNRITTWLIFFIQSTFFIFFDKVPGTKLYFSSNPPIAPFISLFYKLDYFIHIYDVYPDALLASPKINEDSFIYKFIAFLNKISFKNSERIITPSLGMKNMLKKYTNADKILVLNWWADTEYIKPIPKDENLFIKKYNLENKFIIMYSGNFGYTHNIEKILNLAKEMKNINDLMFVIIGSGPKKKIVDDFYLNNNLDNLLVLPFQNEDMLPHSMASSDISIILDSFSYHDKSISTASIPSKTYYLMAAGCGIIAVADEQSELNRLIKKYNLGFVDSRQDNLLVMRFVKKCLSNPSFLKKIKINSRNASKNFTKYNSKKLYDLMINE